MFGLLCTLLGIFLCVTALQTVLFYMVWYYDRRNFPDQARVAVATASDEPVRLLPGVLAMVLEWLALSILFLTWPLRLIHDVAPVKVTAEGATPTIFVHGYGGTSFNLAWLQLMLKRRGFHNVYAVSYTPPTIDARVLAQQLADHVDRLLAATGAAQVNLVCHSMGGPLSRYALLHCGLEGKVNKVVTLGSPHAGSRISALFRPRGAVQQLRYQSEFMQELNALDPTPGGAQYYSIYSNFDDFIIPSSSAMLGGNAINLHVPYHGHCALLYSPRVLTMIEQCLAEAA